MSLQNLKDTILALIPDNVMRLISPERARNAYNSIIDFFWDITGDKSDLETTDKSSLVNAINELKYSNGFVITEKILTNGQSFLFPEMTKGEAFVIRIIEYDGSSQEGIPSPDGMVWLGGYDGVGVGNDTVVICVSNSVGGSYSDVGYQFVIINQGKDSEVIFVDELPDENLARTGVIYILNSNNAMYIWDSQQSDYVLIGDVVPGTLISLTVFEDENNNVVVPEANKIYFDTTTEIYYRWNGSEYVPVIGLDSIEEVSATNPGIVNNEPLQELGGADKLINGLRIGRGAGNVQTNTVLGENALEYNQSGYRNTAIGNEAMRYFDWSDSGAFENTAVGDMTLWFLENGSLNTAVGASAMFNLEKGSFNTSLGYMSGFRLGKGEDVEYNTLIGALSGGMGFSSYIEGDRNTIIGAEATSNLSTGSNNVTVGYKSANSLRTGNHNIIIGVQSGDKTTLTPPADTTWDFGDRNIFIGRLAGVWEVPNLAEDYLVIHSYHNESGEDKTPLILGHFTDRFLRIGGELELDPQFLPAPDATFTKKLVYNPTDGKVTAVDDAGGVGTIYIELTKTQLDTAITNNELVPGALYKITEVETWMKQGDTTKAIYLHAISTNELEKKGTGEFYVPKYNQGVAGYGIWSGELWQKTSGAMGTEPSYNADDVVIWGGKHWKNLTGDYGTFIDHYELDGTNWEEIPVNDTDYNIRINIIEYDYANDMITYRKDEVGNEVSTSYKNWKYYENTWFGGNPLSDSNYNPTKIVQWGNELDYSSYVGVGTNIVKNGIFECINQRGATYENTIIKGVFYNNTTNSGYVINNNLNYGFLYYNTLNSGNMSNNNVENGSYIYNNTLNNGTFIYNSLDKGRIYNNTIGNNGRIEGNTLNNGRIHDNTLNNGRINYNTLNSGFIDNNTLNSGSIFNNTIENNGFISKNTIENNGFISTNNLNNGSMRLGLSNPINNKQIRNLTINTGDIGGFSGIDLSSATLVYQTYERIVFKDSTGTTKIRYYDGSGNLVVADLTD